MFGLLGVYNVNSASSVDFLPVCGEEYSYCLIGKM